MPCRYLLGPVTPPFQDQHLAPARAAGRCLTFGWEEGCDLPLTPESDWASLARHFPAGWSPDLLVLYLPYSCVPAALWAAPVPVAGLLADAAALWPTYGPLLPHCDLLLAGPDEAAALAAAGRGHALPAPLWCLQQHLPGPWPRPPERPLDLLVACDPGGGRWLALAAALADRWRVRAVAWDDPGFARECGRARLALLTRPFAAAARHHLAALEAGALVLTPGTLPLPGWGAGVQYLSYREDALAPLLERRLADGAGSRGLVEAADRALEGMAVPAWEDLLGLLEGALPPPAARAARRPAPDARKALLLQARAALQGAAAPRAALCAGLRRLAHGAGEAGVLAWLGPLAALGEGGGAEAGPALTALPWLERAAALAPGCPLARFNLGRALAWAGRPEAAGPHFRDAVRLLRDGPPALPEGGWPVAGPAEGLALGWARAAWRHEGDPAGLRRARAGLLYAHAQAWLAGHGGGAAAAYEAALAAPEAPGLRGLLGRCLLRAGAPALARPHLRAAWEADPGAADAADGLERALGDLGEGAALADFRALRARADGLAAGAAEGPPRPAPPAEPAGPPRRVPADPPLVSLCLIVKDEARNLEACLKSAGGLFDEVVVLDTGSSDGTPDLARRLGARVFDSPWADSFAAARNAAIDHARGDWIFWLDADDRLDAANARGLAALLARLPRAPAAYLMACRCAAAPGAPAGVEVSHVRLFRRHPALRWEYRVHEQILRAARALGHPVHATEVAIDHVGYADPALKRGKLLRNLRLLQLEAAERPGEVPVLFYLGWTLLQLGDAAGAAPRLEAALARAAPGLSLLPKLYALLAQARQELGRPAEALALCLEGRRRCPGDGELLFQAGLLHQGLGRWGEAEACFRALLGGRPGPSFNGLDAGVHGYKSLHNLAVLCRRQGRLAEAEDFWARAAREEPRFLPAWLGLGELQLRRGDGAAFAGTLEGLRRHGPGSAEAAALGARGLAAGGDPAAARALLEESCRLHPGAVLPRLALCRLLAEQGDAEAAGRACAAVLELDPGHAEALALRRRAGGGAGPA